MPPTTTNPPRKRTPMEELARHDARVGKLAADLLSAETVDEVRAKTRRMISKAIAGDAAAADLLLSVLLYDQVELEQRLEAATSAACATPAGDPRDSAA